MMYDNITMVYSVSLWYGLHGLLMVLGWLILIPAGIYVGTVGRCEFPGSHWQFWHRLLVLSGAAIIGLSAAVSLCLTRPHFQGIHQIADFIFNVALLIQTLLELTPECLPQNIIVSRLLDVLNYSGISIYLGGMINVFIGLVIYQTRFVPDGILKNVVFFLSGVIAVAEFLLLTDILAAWWQNCCNDAVFLADGYNPPGTDSDVILSAV